MTIFRFLKKYTNKQTTVFLIVLSIIAIATLLSIDLIPFINTSFLYLLASVVLFIIIMLRIRKASKDIEEIIIEDNHIKIYFFNKAKDPVTLNSSDILVYETLDKIEFLEKKSEKLIGIALKHSLEDKDNWNKLIEITKKMNNK